MCTHTHTQVNTRGDYTPGLENKTQRRPALAGPADPRRSADRRTRLGVCVCVCVCVCTHTYTRARAHTHTHTRTHTHTHTHTHTGLAGRVGGRRLQRMQPAFQGRWDRIPAAVRSHDASGLYPQKSICIVYFLFFCVSLMTPLDSILTSPVI